MSLYCKQCMKTVAAGLASCPICGANVLHCLKCMHQVHIGSATCATCQQTALTRSAVIEVPAELVPDLPPIGAVVVSPRVAPVLEQYSAGRHGVNAEVRIPAGDVAIMNELGQLVAVLHTMAARLNGFVGLTEHTRQLIRDMRHLATDIQEEIETRRGPQG